MIGIYNVIYCICFILLSPFFLWKMLFLGKYRAGLFNRFGLVSSQIKKRLKKRKTLWIHAVSVGEVLSIVALVKELQVLYSDHIIVVTTVTNTGNEIARKHFSRNSEILYFPLDFYPIMHSFLDCIHPSLIIVAEADIWPNLLFSAQKRGIPLCMINGRLSSKSYKRYMQFSFFFSKLLHSISFVSVQSEKDRKRFIDLGVIERKIKKVSSLKWEDYLCSEISQEEKNSLMMRLGFSDNDVVLVCGSTHDKEEEVLLSVYGKLKDMVTNLRLIIAPRHPERFKIVREMLRSSVHPFRLWTEVKEGLTNRRGAASVILLDTMGELSKMYSLATIAFIGKSLYKKGGQNIIEPIRLQKPVIFGPHMENFEYIAGQVKQAGGAIQIQNETELYTILEDLITHPEKIKHIGECAYAVLRKHQGGLQKNLSVIKELYPPS
ncbi:3-deoxy-D-manno-octulosonic acid transferase [Chlamydiota bacterium]